MASLGTSRQTRSASSSSTSWSTRLPRSGKRQRRSTGRATTSPRGCAWWCWTGASGPPIREEPDGPRAHPDAYDDAGVAQHVERGRVGSDAADSDEPSDEDAEDQQDPGAFAESD